MKKITKIFLVAFCALLIFGALPVSAVEPYQTYTYSSEGYALWSPAAYKPLQAVDSGYIGLYEAAGGVPFNDPADIETDNQGNVYLSDTKNNRVIVMNEYYKLKFIISEFVKTCKSNPFELDEISNFQFPESAFTKTGFD